MAQDHLARREVKHLPRPSPQQGGEEPARRCQAGKQPQAIEGLCAGSGRGLVRRVRRHLVKRYTRVERAAAGSLFQDSVHGSPIFFSVFIGLAWAGVAHAQSDLGKGFSGASRGCEEWVLRPTTWLSGGEPFVAAVGLGDRMRLVERVDEVALPPNPLRVSNHYWRINSTIGAGYILVVSDRLPMCHITGGGDTDLQPVIASVLDTPVFAERWKLVKTSSRGDMLTSEFQNREEPAFSIEISRAARTGQPLDPVQVLATATFRTGT